MVKVLNLVDDIVVQLELLKRLKPLQVVDMKDV